MRASCARTERLNMAVTIQSITPASAYDSALDFKTDIELIGLALGGNLAAAAKCVRDGFDFLVQARSTAAETATVIELMTAKGVPFPAGFFRILEIEAYVSGNASDETGYLRKIAAVSGGATPILRVIQNGATAATDQGFFSAVAGAGFAATPACAVTVGAGVVNVQITSAEAEILNWTVKVKVGKLVPLIAGV